MRTRLRFTAAVAVAAVALLITPAAAQATPYPGPNGPKDVHGLIEQKWLSLNKAPGDPLNDETPTAKPGAFNDFTRQAIYYSPDAGTHTIGGAFYQYWAARGWETGALGFPSSDEVGLRGGVMQQFQGNTLYWSPGTGAHQVSGDFYQLWDAKGWEQGILGYPGGEQAAAAADGTFQRFQYGAIYEEHRYSTPGLDDAYSISGAFYPFWAGQGYERGRLGYPTSEENSFGGNLVSQYFTGGTLYWTPCKGVTVNDYDFCD